MFACISDTNVYITRENTLCFVRISTHRIYDNESNGANNNVSCYKYTCYGLCTCNIDECDEYKQLMMLYVVGHGDVSEFGGNVVLN